MNRTILLLGAVLGSIILIGIPNGNVMFRYKTIESYEEVIDITSPILNKLNVNGTRSNNWSIQTVDSQGCVGEDSSIALDTTDRPHISYCNYPNDGLKYAFYDGAQWHNETVDSEGCIVDGSIALDSNNWSHISYYDSTEGLKYAFNNGVQWYSETVSEESGMGFSTSIALDTNDRPHISYSCDDGINNAKFNYAYYDGVQWHIEIVDSQGDVGHDTSIALDSNDHPHISYVDNINGDLKYAYYDGQQWHNETVDSQGYVGYYSSIVLDISDKPHISYSDDTNYGLRYAYHDGNQWNTETVDSMEEYCIGTSIALDSNNLPHISYDDWYRRDLKYAYNDGSLWHIEIIDSERNVGSITSLALDSNDRPHISYCDSDNTALKYAVMDALPPLLTDNSPNIGTTGDNFFLNITTKGKAGVASVKVNWSHGNIGNNQSLKDDGDDTWSLTIPLDHCINPLEYNFIVNDTLGNIFSYSVQTVDVTDNDIPSLDEVNSPDIGTTGDSFQFNISVFDNIDIETVFINWTHRTLGSNISLKETNGYWIRTIQLDHNIEDLIYFIYIQDTSHNVYISSQLSVTVTDNDSPLLEEVTTQAPPTTGDPFTIRINATDNIVLELVQINYTFNKDVDHEVSMDYNIDHSWSNTVIIPPNAVYMEYCFHMKDAANNWLHTNISQKNVFDNDKPEASAGSDKAVNQFDNITVDSSQSYDNVGIVTYTWKFMYSNAEQIFFGKQFHFAFEVAGTYKITLNVTDEGGNWDTDFLLVEVKDMKSPNADAGEPQTKNQGVSLILDGSASFDENGITNYTWTFRYENEDCSLYGELVTFKFDYPGLYNITLSVQDMAGNADSDFTVVTINDAEIPVANATTGNLVFKVGSTVVFDGTGSSDNVGIVNYTWTFNDNGLQILYGELPSYVFNYTGEYMVTLTVMDGAGNIGRTTCSITVEKEMMNQTIGKTGDDALFTVFGFGIEWQDILGAVGSILSFLLGFLLLTRKRRRYKRYEAKLTEIDNLNELEQLFESEILPLIENEKITPHHSVLIKGAYDEKRADFKIWMKHDDNLKTYKGALKKALQDGEISADEESMLTELRETLEITKNEHNNLLKEWYGKLQEGMNVEAVWDTEEEEKWGKEETIISQSDKCVFCSVILDIAGKEMECPKCGAKYNMKGKLLDDEEDIWSDNVEEFEEDDIWD